jgi:hypothetical protein
MGNKTPTSLDAEARRCRTISDAYSAEVPSHGVVMIKVMREKS